MTTYREKYEFLVANGYLSKQEDDFTFSLSAVAAFSGTSPDRWKASISDGVARLSNDLARDARRGYRELSARVGTNDPVEVLYAAVTAHA